MCRERVKGQLPAPTHPTTFCIGRRPPVPYGRMSVVRSVRFDDSGSAKREAQEVLRAFVSGAGSKRTSAVAGTPPKALQHLPDCVRSLQVSPEAPARVLPPRVHPRTEATVESDLVPEEPAVACRNPRSDPRPVARKRRSVPALVSSTSPSGPHPGNEGTTGCAVRVSLP